MDVFLNTNSNDTTELYFSKDLVSTDASYTMLYLKKNHVRGV